MLLQESGNCKGTRFVFICSHFPVYLVLSDRKLSNGNVDRIKKYKKELNLSITYFYAQYIIQSITSKKKSLVIYLYFYIMRFTAKSAGK